MKKILSLGLAAAMAMSAIPMAYATTNYTNGTQVEYDANDRDGDGQLDNLYYTITVPALLNPKMDAAVSGTVTLKGMWPSDATVKVTADTSVELTNSINSADKHNLAITFAGIEKAGDNTVEKEYTETVSLAQMPAAALFGTWEGHFNYNVEYVEPVELITFKYTNTYPIVCTAEKGMTWEEFVNSEYNVDGFVIRDGGIYCGNSAAVSATTPNDTIVENGFYTSP